MFILAIICCLYKVIVYLTHRHQSQNLENTNQNEQNTNETDNEQNTDKTDESFIGKKVVVDDIKCTIIGVDKFGKPCAWLSDELPLNIEPPYNWCTREYAMKLKFNNGWHIPSYDELLKYKQTKICWTTTFYDTMCYYGNPNDKDYKPKRSVRIIKTI
jgi:hypothetical protein